MQIIKADEQFIPRTSGFAREVFIDYYDHLIGNAQATYMAELFLSEEAIGKLIEDGAVFIIVMDRDEIVGFSEYAREDDRVFLSKLYVRKDRRGKGIGRMMFEECKRYALSNGIFRIYLTVNKHNTPSYETYLHLGFRVVDSVVNDIGHGYVMDDYIMELELK